MLYQISNGAVAYADDLVLHDINFEIRNTEKIAIVGRNGCGGGSRCEGRRRGARRARRGGEKVSKKLAAL